MGTHLNRLGEAVLTCTHNLCFEQKLEKYQKFPTDNFQFLKLKKSLYIAWAVFVMYMTTNMGATDQALEAKVIKLFSSSSQLSIKFQLFINVEIVKNCGKFSFKTQKLVIYPADKC